MPRLEKTIGVVTALALLVTACTGGTDTDETLPGGTSPEPTVVQAAGALVQFDACDEFLDYVIGHAVDLVGPYGFDSGPIFWPAEADGAEFADDRAASGERFSETNVQVEGVDEPDMVKTDGERIVVLNEGTLIVVDVTADEPNEIGRISVGELSVQSLFLDGDTVLLFGSVWGHGPIPLPRDGDAAIAPIPSTPTMRIVEVDIAGDPQITGTMTVDGAFISGRMVDDSVRLVLTSSPVGFEWSYPTGSGLRAERRAIEENREIVRNSTEENWIPYYVTTDARGNVTGEGTLFDCDRAAHPSEFSGVDMLSMVTIDISSGLDVSDATGVLARGDTIYASEQSLYVATQNWQSWRWIDSGDARHRPDGPTTDIHKFDIGDPRHATYLASGSVEGYLLNQFAMDEHDGILRVASTTSPAWWGSGPDSESRVTMLREIGDGLVRVGLIDGLGATEQIYSVRFMGDTAYIVTFRQTDPLYTLDLSDPRRPELVGELKIPGYSAYLHPVGAGLLMGIGQDATDEGMTLGTQVSIFDVSDLADPTRIDTHTLSEGTNSSVEYDHHAFLYWEGLAVIPIQQWKWDDRSEEVFMGAVALRVTDEGNLVDLGEVVHPGGDDKSWDWRAQIVRTVVIGDSVYTISGKGIMKSDLDDLTEESWLEF